MFHDDKLYLGQGVGLHVWTASDMLRVHYVETAGCELESQTPKQSPILLQKCTVRP